MNEKYPEQNSFSETLDDLLAMSFTRLQLIQESLDSGSQFDTFVDEVTGLTEDICIAAGESGKLLIQSDHLYTMKPDDESEEITLGVAPEMQELEFVGLLVQEFSRIGYDKPTIFLKFRAGQFSQQSEFIESEGTFFALAAVNDASISLPVSVELPSRPEDGDPLATDIDEIILNTPIDLGALDALLSNSFGQMSELQKEYYLDYINQLCDFNYAIVQTERCYILPDDDTTPIMLSSSKGQDVLEGDFHQFSIVGEYDTDDSLIDYHLILELIRSDTRIGVLTQDITDITIA